MLNAQVDGIANPHILVLGPDLFHWISLIGPTKSTANIVTRDTMASQMVCVACSSTMYHHITLLFLFTEIYEYINIIINKSHCELIFKN